MPERWRYWWWRWQGGWGGMHRHRWSGSRHESRQWGTGFRWGWACPSQAWLCWGCLRLVSNITHCPYCKFCSILNKLHYFYWLFFAMQPWSIYPNFILSKQAKIPQMRSWNTVDKNANYRLFHRFIITCLNHTYNLEDKAQIPSYSIIMHPLLPR